MKIAEVKNVILEGLRPFAEMNGYRINKGRFGIFSKENNPKSSIDFVHHTWDFFVEIIPFVCVKFKDIHEICELCGFNLNYTVYIRLLMLEEIQKHGWYKSLIGKMQIEQTDRLSLIDYDSWVEDYRKKYPKARDLIIYTGSDDWIERCNERIGSLLPCAEDFINKYSTIESIDKLYNELPIRRNPYCMGWADHSMIGIISAKLAHNPEYDKIKDTYIRIVKKQTYSEYFRQSFYRAIDYLEKAGV